MHPTLAINTECANLNEFSLIIVVQLLENIAKEDLDL